LTNWSKPAAAAWIHWSIKLSLAMWVMPPVSSVPSSFLYRRTTCSPHVDHTYAHTHTDMHTHIHGHIDRHRHKKQIESLTQHTHQDQPKDRQTRRQTYIQKSRETGRESESKRDRQGKVGLSRRKGTYARTRHLRTHKAPTHAQVSTSVPRIAVYCTLVRRTLRSKCRGRGRERAEAAAAACIKE